MEETQRYMMEHNIPQLFEGLMTALMYKKPENHIEFLEKCLSKAKGERQIRWNSFINPLPPIKPEQKDTTSLIESKTTATTASIVKELPSLSSPLPPIRKSSDEEEKGSYIVQAQTESVTYTAVGIHSKPLLNENRVCMRSLGEGATDPIDRGFQYNESIYQSKKNFFFVLGGPGVGKGTQCKILKEVFGFAHISAGDLLREEMKANGSQSQLIQSCIKEGKLVPQDVILDLLSKKINKEYQSFGGFLIDGFPREVQQGIEFESKIHPATGILMFDCPTNVLKERLMKRALTSNRSDDNEETIEKRLLTFEMKTLPVLQHFRDKVIKINANRSINEIASDLKRTICKINDARKSKNFNDEFLKQLQNDMQRSEDEYPGNNSNFGREQYPTTGLNSNDHHVKFQRQDKVVNEDICEYSNPLFTGENGLTQERLGHRRFISIIGATNTGKSSLCQQLSTVYGLHHINCDQLIDDECDRKTKLGMTIQKFKEDKEMVPTGIIIHLLAKALDVLPDDAVVAFDGYPKAAADLTKFRMSFGFSNMIAIESPVEDIISRIKSNSNQFLKYGNNDDVLAYEIDRQLKQTKEMIMEISQNPWMPISTIVNKGESIGELVEEVCELLIVEGQTEFKSNFYTLEMEQQNIIFVLGGPGSGKGTQCAKIVEKYGYCHLSTGDLLRDEVKSGTPRAEKLKQVMESGGLVSQDTILELLKDAIAAKKDSKGFLIDGFPRDIPQGEKFETEIGACKFILYFDCSNEEMTKRLLERAKSSGRVDDNEETIKKRLKTFEEQTLPVLDKYGKVEKTRKVNAERSIDAIFLDVCKALDG